MEQLQQEVASFETAYRQSSQAAGPTKWPRFAEFLRDAYGGAVRDLAARQEERQRVAAQQAAQQAEHARLHAQQVSGGREGRGRVGCCYVKLNLLLQHSEAAAWCAACRPLAALCFWA